MSINKDTRSGRILFGEKSANYLKKLSRTAVENYSNTSLLFFEIDYEKSKRNLYGELVYKAWKNPLGIEVKGIISLNSKEEIQQGDIPNKIMSLNFTVYLDHLKELGIEPKLGDYFSAKNRFYFIYDRILLDSNQVSLGVDREAMYIKYICIQADDEQIQIPGDGQRSLGTANDIRNEKQY
jgi:hypothetical protein